MFPRGTNVTIKSTDSTTFIIVSTSQKYSEENIRVLYERICSAQKPVHLVQSSSTHRGGHGQHNGGHGQYARPEESTHYGTSSVQTPRQGLMFRQGAWLDPRSNNGT